MRGRVVLLVSLGIVAASSFAVPGVSAQPDYPDPDPVSGDTVVHDPTMIQRQDGSYALFSTHEGLQMRTSADGIDWTRTEPALPAGAAWASAYTDGGDPAALWAPDISYHDGTYWLYYSASSFGSNHSAIGLATSETGEPGSFQDQGVVYSTSAGDNHNAIDPNLTVDADGRWWLAFGSHWTGIKMIELDPATGKPDNDTVHDLARRTGDSTAIEAPTVVRQGDDYYLFVSFDTCCAGVDSTYRVMVGRSDEVTGPYLDADGVPMSEGGGTEILASHGDRVIGPGGQSVLRAGDTTRLVYHYYDGAAAGAPTLGLNTLEWDSNGWPRLR